MPPSSPRAASRPVDLRVIKALLWILCLLPLLHLVWDGVGDGLGANPVEAITHRTGDWTLRLLLITLGMTPTRRLTGWTWPLRVRRLLGLFAFFYACLHFGTYLVLDQFFCWSAIVEDLAKRPYITVGFTAFVLLIPLAVTSTRGMMRRLGRHWQRLHRLVYLVTTLGVLHYLWLVKADYREPIIYLLCLLVLLGVRVWFRRQRASHLAPLVRSA